MQDPRPAGRRLFVGRRFALRRTPALALMALACGAAAAQEGMVAVQIVAAIAVGAAVTSVIFRALAQRGKREANSPKDAA